MNNQKEKQMRQQNSDGAKARGTGSRAALPSDALKRCPSCGRVRGNTRKNWTPITRNGEVVGYTCADCPRWDEPIRRKLTRRGAVRFVAVVSVTERGERRQAYRTFGALDAARSWVTETRKTATQVGQQTRTGRFTDPSRLTLRALCDGWVAERRSEVGTPGGIREVSVNGYSSSLHSVLYHAGDRIARELSADDFEALLRKLLTVGGKRGRPLAHRSVVYALGTLRQVYTWGIRRGWLISNPAADAKLPRKHHGPASSNSRTNPKSGGTGARVLRWSPVELAGFRAHADSYGEGQQFAADPWVTAGMRLTLCGVRRSEVLGVDWTAVDLEAGSVVVRASRVKTGRGNATALGGAKTENSYRTIVVEEIHPGSVAAFRTLWLAQGRPTSGLIIRNADGLPVHPDRYSRVFRKLCREAGVPVLWSIHNVRHSIGTALQAEGVPDHEAAALLGHDVDTYRRFYLVTDDDAAASAASAAGRLFAAAAHNLPHTQQ